jgi:hypothetical protein
VTYPHPARAATPRVPEQMFDPTAAAARAARQHQARAARQHQARAALEAAAARAALEAAAARAALCNKCYKLHLILNKILTFTINHVRIKV